MYLLIPSPEKVGTWWDLNPHCLGGRRCNHIMRISIAKTHMVYILPEKGVFVLLIPTPEKVGTWWDLNPHCSAGRRCNHITRISQLAKYPKFGDVNANCRDSMTGKY